MENPFQVPSRVYYFNNELLDADDFIAEQSYGRDMLNLHNGLVHEFGIAAGLVVSGISTTPPPSASMRRVSGANQAGGNVAAANALSVSAGLAIDSAGNEIYYNGDPAIPHLPATAGDYFLTINSSEVTDPAKKRITQTPAFKYYKAGDTFNWSMNLVLASFTLSASGEVSNISAGCRTEAGLRAGRIAVSSRAAYPATGEAAIQTNTMVTGTGTLFLAEMRVGDRIQVQSELRFVTAIQSNTELTVDTAWTTTTNCATLMIFPAALRVESPAGETKLFTANGKSGDPSATDFTLNVIGEVISTSSVNSSDLRLKENVQPIDEALARVLALRGVRFQWNRELDRSYPAGARMGLIGQDVEAVAPEAVRLDCRGYRAVDYASLTGLLVEAMKEQQSKIDAQAARLEELERTVQELRGRTRER